MSDDGEPEIRAMEFERGDEAEWFGEVIKCPACNAEFMAGDYYDRPKFCPMCGFQEPKS